jgi:hypothetical protein
MRRSSRDRYIAGDHNVICDISGQKRKRSECMYTWDGLLVSKDKWDPKHPQLNLRGKEDKIAVPDTRPRRAEPVFYTPTEEEL